MVTGDFARFTQIGPTTNGEICTDRCSGKCAGRDFKNSRLDHQDKFKPLDRTRLVFVRAPYLTISNQHTDASQNFLAAQLSEKESSTTLPAVSRRSTHDPLNQRGQAYATRKNLNRKQKGCGGCQVKNLSCECHRKLTSFATYLSIIYYSVSRRLTKTFTLLFNPAILSSV